MAKESIPIGLPNCALLRELVKKTAALKTAPSRTPAYLEWLKALRDRIAPELSYTIVTFPLFTPHDEQNHVHPLFIMAERLLGPDVIKSLNAAELFVLACSLYSHDWGMAVSEAEKKCIFDSCKPPPADSFSLPEGKENAFKELLQESRIDEPRTLSDVPLEIWQTYIRKTHAARSAQRVRAFFSEIDKNLGEAVAIVSEGHNLDLEHIRQFETSLPLQGESANIRALALYLRLIDLFDLAQDRTPYALWKFISPEDPKSADEWEKHRALSPVGIESFQETSRCIRVRGSTDDHRVYAALEDLREYCDSQLRVSNGLLNELDARYQPRLLYLDWKVEAKGFEPITVRFELDRREMLNMLSNEIYKGDHYVFLRELLQNSIDAIRLRRALHQKKDTGLNIDGKICVKVEHQSDGRAIVSWTDNGCGMSTFVVRNYLTVAGRSFYKSEDFQKLGVKMDPISRFGIGILSCFLVADSLEIITRQDSDVVSSAEALKIEVCNPNRHLRIQRCIPDALPPIGTTVQVFVGRFAGSERAKTVPAKLDVTGYLRDIAGFVEFPIYVEEDGKRTVIVKPDSVASFKAESGWEVVALDLSFAWQDFFVPQDALWARDFFTEEKITIKPNAKNMFLEGTISFPVLKEDIELRRRSSVLSSYEEAFTAFHETKKLGEFRIQKPSRDYKLEFHSSRCNNMCRIYCDGILVDALPPSWSFKGWFDICIFRIVLNIPQAARTRLDLSRGNILDCEVPWSEILFERCAAFLRKKVKQIVTRYSPKEALYRLARLVTYSCAFPYGDLSKIFSGIAIPLLVIEETGDVIVRSTRSLTVPINVIPESMARGLGKKLFVDWGSRNWLQHKAMRISWFGGLSVFRGYSYVFDAPVSLYAVRGLSTAWLETSYNLGLVRFLLPGEEKKPPLMQEIWVPKKFHRCRSNECDWTTESVKMTLGVRTSIKGLGWLYIHPPDLVEFAAPFQDFFTAGWAYLNILHPMTQLLAECIQAITDKHSAGAISKHDLGMIRDVCELFLREECYHLIGEGYPSDHEFIERYKQIRRLFDLTAQLEIFKAPPDLSWSERNLNVPVVTEAGRLGAPIQSLSEVGL